MKIRILTPAEDDLEEGFRFYESQSPGLGSYFLDSLYSDIDSLAYFGGIHQVVFGYYRQLSKRFPFAVYYRIINNVVVGSCGLCCPRLSSEPKLDKRKTDEGLTTQTSEKGNRRRIPMKKELFKELLDSVKQGGAIMKGTIKPLRTFSFPESEVRKIREKYGLSQDKFATLIGISAATLRNWEQGRRKPEGPARVLLRVAATHPDVLLNIIANKKARKQV